MEVFQNGLTGLLVVRRVGVDSNYVIETVPVPFQRMEEKVVRAGILQMCEHVWWALATCQVIMSTLFLILLWFIGTIIFYGKNFNFWQAFQKRKMLLFDCGLNHSFIFVRVLRFCLNSWWRFFWMVQLDRLWCCVWNWIPITSSKLHQSFSGLWRKKLRKQEFHRRANMRNGTLSVTR